MEIRNEGCRGEDLITSATNKSQRSQQWEEQYTQGREGPPSASIRGGRNCRAFELLLLI
jgi:hypothetical protein